ncbi:MAG: metal-dependent hydrolase [Candidatus Cloacimonadota bacterium]|nr:MAG: metal-dependent hydrolase [Candidatus Cloacimonadota bacterium]
MKILQKVKMLRHFSLFFILVSLVSCSNIRWFGHSSIEIITPNGTKILIDPWINNPKNPNGKTILTSLHDTHYILLSHGHGDHIGDTRDILSNSNAKIITSYSLGNHLLSILKYPKDRVLQKNLGDVGGEIQITPEIKITFTQAIHSSEIIDTKGILHNTGPSVGFIIEIKNDKTVYFSGDTDLMFDMKLIPLFHKIDLFIVCIGNQFTMGPKRAALATNMIKASSVLPVHWGTYPLLTGTPQQFKTYLDQFSFTGHVYQLDMNQRVHLK